MRRLVGIEIGGTKIVVGLGNPDQIVAREVIPTTDPASSLGAVRRVVQVWHRQRPIDAVGIASFGPVRVDPEAEDYGRILDTPKPGWSHTSLIDALTIDDIPMAIDTDVNGAVLAEATMGAAIGCTSAVYLTIGTGLGGGVMVGGNLVHGFMHPEIGHIAVRKHPADDFKGVCPFHGDCAEGLLCGPALLARFGEPPEDVHVDDLRWEGPAFALGELCATLILTLSTQRIIIGGGVALGRPKLIERARNYAAKRLNGYLSDIDTHMLQNVIVMPSLGNDAGVIGAMTLANTAN